YRRTLIEKYRGHNVHFRAHGIFSARPEYPDFSLRGNPEHRILAFGKWGTYKRLETLLESFANILEKLPHTRLVIAGSDHPATPGYVESVARRFHDCPRIEFRGYVAEEDIPELFRTSSVLVMPYNSATGASGVAHLACQYGRSFNLHQRARVFQPISRFRRVPSWVPSRSSLFRAAVPRWEAWM